MKNAIKVICFVLAVIVIGVSSCYIYFTWDIGEFEVSAGSEKGTVIITNYLGNNEDVVIPKSLRGKKVVSIDNSAFQGIDNIKSVTIGENVKSVGNNAFQDCENLQKIDMGISVERLGNMAFANCPNLTEVKFSPVLKEFGHMVWGNIENNINVDLNGNKNFVFDKGILYSSDYSVIYESLIAADLTDYVLPETVVELRPYAFYMQKELKTLKLNSGITTIPEGCFIQCSGLTELVLPDTVTSIATVVLAGSGIETVTIPDSVVKIDDFAFIKDGSEINIVDKLQGKDDENSAVNTDPAKKITIITTEGSFASTFARRHNFNLKLVDSL